MVDTTAPMSLDEIQYGLQGERLLLVADATGLSYPTINKLATGEVTNYSLDTIIRVSQYLYDKED